VAQDGDAGLDGGDGAVAEGVGWRLDLEGGFRMDLLLVTASEKPSVSLDLVCGGRVHGELFRARELEACVPKCGVGSLSGQRSSLD